MYAITFDLDTKALEQHYPVPNWRNAYNDIAVTLSSYGFERQQGSVYFGNSTVTAVTWLSLPNALDKHLRMV